MRVLFNSAQPRELRLEYAAMVINVNAICPGFYRTDLGGGSDDPDFV